ncbi:fucose-binding lectin II [Burkholderia cepacia]|uniref:fucose-binding lectin II n=1 Tax=Burkholderia cepacia TaxID=292 RepID=UPI000A7A3C27|nr:fucose-binding lectin II [Burkholderia cepacia]
MSTIQPSSNRSGEFTLPPNIKFRVVLFANAVEQQHIKVFIDDSTEPALYKKLTTRDGTREATLNSGNGKVRVEVSVNGKLSATDARLAPINGKSDNGTPFTVNFGIVVSEQRDDTDYNDGIVVLQWPVDETAELSTGNQDAQLGGGHPADQAAGGNQGAPASDGSQAGQGGGGSSADQAAGGNQEASAGSGSAGDQTGGTPAIDANTLKYGDRVHLLNGYNNWNGGYLDTYDYSKQAGAKHGVITADTPTRDGGSGTWVIESVTGKAKGTAVLSGDAIRLFNAYGNNGGYLDTNGHAGAPELYNVSTADKTSRGAHKTLDWVVESGTAGSPVKIGDQVALRNEYNNSQGGFLDTCYVFEGQTTKAFRRGTNTKYAVYTHSTSNRAGQGTGHWKFLRSTV